MFLIKEGETNWKYLLIVAIIAVAAGAGFLWCVEKSGIKAPEDIVKDETAGWKIYQNKKYGFQFKYPADVDIYSKSGQMIEMGYRLVPPTSSSTDVTVYELKQEAGQRPYNEPTFKVDIVTEAGWLDKTYPDLKLKPGLNLKVFSMEGKEAMEAENFDETLYKLLVVEDKEGFNIIVRQNRKTNFLDSIFKTFILIKKEKDFVVPQLIEKSFSYPYPISWQEEGINFSLTGISFGRIPAPDNLLKSSGDHYNKGEEINALTLILKIKNPKDNPQCVNLNIRRELNEEGDMTAPNTDQFRFPSSGGCILSGTISYAEQKVIFVVPESRKSFNITTGGKSNIFFTINVLEADRIVREQPDLQLEKSIEEEGIRQLTPYYADVPFCYDAGKNKYNTTGYGSEFQSWFVHGGCPRAKYYKVVPGKEMILNVNTDIITCPDCVCNYPDFSMYEYIGGGFKKTKDFNFTDVGGVFEKVYYTPTSDKIKIEADKCFYLDVFQEGEARLPKVSLISPNGGDQLEAGKTYRILWNSSGISKNINIELENKDCLEGKSDCRGWEINFNRIPASLGFYDWNIGSLPMGSNYSYYKVHIWSNENVNVEDYSNNYFSIVKAADVAKPYIKVSSPNGGEKWYFGQTQTITWKSNLRGTVALYLAFPDGGMCYIGSAPVDQESFIFSLKENQSCAIPRNITPGTYRIALVADNDTKDEYLYAYSDGSIIISIAK